MPVSALENNESLHKYFHSFCVRPHLRFESQHNDETVLLVVRAHPITFIPWITTSLIASLIPLILTGFISNFLSFPYVVFVNIFWYSLVFSYAFLSVLVWLFNVGVVTNERVVDVDYHDILRKEVSGTSLEDITDVTARTTGFIRSFFSFGDVSVQTAGREQNIEFDRVPDPNEVVSFINRLMR